MMENIEQEIESLKETIAFLIDQEKIRGEEVAALNDKIEAAREYLTEMIIEPSIKRANEDRFDKFNGQYGERFSRFDDVMKSVYGPDYSSTRAVYDEYYGMPEDERKAIDEEAYLSDAESRFEAFIDNVKASLGVSPDSDVVIQHDGETGETVATAVDGQTGEVVEEKIEEGEAVAAPANEETVNPEEAAVLEEEIIEADPELLKELDEWAKKDDNGQANKEE